MLLSVEHDFLEIADGAGLELSMSMADLMETVTDIQSRDLLLIRVLQAQGIIISPPKGADLNTKRVHSIGLLGLNSGYMAWKKISSKLDTQDIQGAGGDCELN
ncbi:hypothetical protein BGX24_000954 [Mortierella sp. AD032]|nr:hypothetical protein BGX24_000954 [Mortierella sp. AD032]